MIRRISHSTDHDHIAALKAVHASGLFRCVCPCFTLLFRLKAGEGADNGFGLGCYTCNTIDATAHQDASGWAIGQWRGPPPRVGPGQAIGRKVIVKKKSD